MAPASFDPKVPKNPNGLDKACPALRPTTVHGAMLGYEARALLAIAARRLAIAASRPNTRTPPFARGRAPAADRLTKPQRALLATFAPLCTARRPMLQNLTPPIGSRELPHEAPASGVILSRAPTGAPAVDANRFELHETLGEGAMGRVVRAFDRKMRCDVAIKTLHSLDPEQTYRLTREFRICAEVVHPNLVELYNLVTDGREAFFSMELLRGTTFVEYVRVPEEGPRAAGVPAATTGADIKRLRAAFAQLAAGLNALHLAGRLHRDIKPANAMVTTEGRVVLLDFGLAAVLDTDPQSAQRRNGLWARSSTCRPSRRGARHCHLQAIGTVWA